MNAAQWNGLPSDQRSRITDILKSTNLLHPGDQIVADEGTPAIQGLTAGGVHTQSFWCTLACDAAEAAAVAACGALPGPAAAVCVAAAHAGGNLCRSKC
jgi:hypothetical protein